MPHISQSNVRISRHSFLKLAFAGVSGAVVLLLSGCLGGEEDEDDDEDDD
jgi:hypothetical protein